MAKKFVSAVTLEAFMTILKEELGLKVSTADVLTSLENYNADTDAEKVVAAAAVEELKNTIDNQDFSSFITDANVVSDLTNLDPDAVQVVAAAVIKDLSDKIDALETSSTDVTEKINAFDADGDGVVDKAADADKLGGQDPDYYAAASDLDGVVKVGDDGKISSDVLPSYVDDVIEGYLADGVFYEDEAHATAIDGEKGKIYLDLASDTNQCYRWSGSAYVEVSSNDMVEITEDEVQEIWDSIE